MVWIDMLMVREFQVKKGVWASDCYDVSSSYWTSRQDRVLAFVPLPTEMNVRRLRGAEVWNGKLGMLLLMAIRS